MNLNKKFFFLMIFSLLTKPIFPILGCLVALEELVPRAENILAGKIMKIEEFDLEPCQESLFIPCEPDDILPLEIKGDECQKSRNTYLKCGKVWKMEIKTKWSLLGNVDKKIEIFVAPYPYDWILILSCDDRPPIPEMMGKEAVFFLTKENSRYWTINGGNSIYVHGWKIKKKDLKILKIIKLIEN